MAETRIEIAARHNEIRTEIGTSANTKVRVADAMQAAFEAMDEYKVEKDGVKVLSDNNFSNTLKEKLDQLPLNIVNINVAYLILDSLAEQNQAYWHPYHTSFESQLPDDIKTGSGSGYYVENISGADENDIIYTIQRVSNKLNKTVSRIYYDGSWGSWYLMGSDKQPLNGDLTVIAGLTPANDDLLQRKSGNWVNRTIAQVKLDLGISTDIAASLATANAYAESLVVGLWDDRGNYNASISKYPSSGGSGTAGDIKKGDIFKVDVAGNDLLVGWTVRALIDTPSTTDANWAIDKSDYGYVPENSVNKATTMSGNTASNVVYLTAKAVYDWAVVLFGTITNIQNSTYLSATATMPTTDAYVAGLSPALTSYSATQKVTILIPTANTTATPTLELEALGALTIVKPDGTALVAGDLKAGQKYDFVKNGSTWQMMGGGGGSAASDVAYDATSWNSSLDAPTKNAVRDKIVTMDATDTSLQNQINQNKLSAYALNY